MLKFKATAVAALEMPDLSSFTVVLAEEHDGSGMRLEIQRALVFDEQDKSLGMDTYCICTEQGAVCYGGIASWSLVENELRIVLDTRAAIALGVKDGFSIELEVDSETRDRLKDGLQRVLNATRLPQSAPGE
jgi:hypothetical protein